MPAFIDQRLVGLALGPGLRQFLARGSGHEDVGDEASSTGPSTATTSLAFMTSSLSKHLRDRSATAEFYAGMSGTLLRN
ncbi:hypothetical protein KHC23_04315 [Ancylobacter dichloromethanicus]|uniref:hypothetical protein n=1 Tax=Ancylobacter dichloromethanicus TaxID=518825 RepID=UPI001BCB7632|nr:hypothetical protein [Ancylobacter dichloromethanicus]MBS7552879.1 hypothetical protein [Ancylobacter dichloromethanicus]